MDVVGMRDIFIRNLMSSEVPCAEPDSELMPVIRCMLRNRYSCTVVVDGRTPVGIFTERDIVGLMADCASDCWLQNLRVREVMSTPVVTVTPETTLFEALVLTTSRQLRHLPVIDSLGELIGLVTIKELAGAHFQVFERQREIIENSINERTQELQIVNEHLKTLSLVDPLLGIGNRRSMEVDLEYTHAQALRHQRGYAAVLFDVDYFKRYNDQYGHLAGDRTLKRVVDFIGGMIRKSDRLYRYGGEEFLLLLPETPPEGAGILAGRIVEGVRDIGIPHARSPYGSVTVSCGIGSKLEGMREPASWFDVVADADRGLYAAKQEGRNRVMTTPQVYLTTAIGA